MESSDLQDSETIIEGDMGEELEGEMEFPEEWMVLDDMDEDMEVEDNKSGGDKKSNFKEPKASSQTALTVPAKKPTQQASNSSKQQQSGGKKVATPTPVKSIQTRRVQSTTPVGGNAPEGTAKPKQTTAPEAGSQESKPGTRKNTTPQSQTKAGSNAPQSKPSTPVSSTKPTPITKASPQTQSKPAAQSKTSGQGTTAPKPSAQPKVPVQGSGASKPAPQTKSSIQGTVTSKPASAVASKSAATPVSKPGTQPKPSPVPPSKTPSSNQGIAKSAPQFSTPKAASGQNTQAQAKTPAIPSVPSKGTTPKTPAIPSVPSKGTTPNKEKPSQVSAKTTEVQSKSQTSQPVRASSSAPSAADKAASQIKSANQSQTDLAKSVEKADERSLTKSDKTGAQSSNQSAKDNLQDKEPLNGEKKGSCPKANVSAPTQKAKIESAVNGASANGKAAPTSASEKAASSATKSTNKPNDNSSKSLAKPSTAASSSTSRKDKSPVNRDSKSDDKSSSKPSRADNQPRSSSSEQSRTRSSTKLSNRSREDNSSRRGSDRRRSRSRSRGHSRDRSGLKRSRNDDRSSKSGDKRPLDAKKSASDLSTSKEKLATASKPATSPKKGENALSKKIPALDKGIQTDDGGDQQKSPQKTNDITKSEKAQPLFEAEPKTMEQGLWRFSLKMSPIELNDLGKPDLRNYMNTAQDCAIYLKNQGPNKKKKGESRLYFNRLLTTKCFMQKLFQMQLSSKKIEIEINRKILNSTEKDLVTLDLDVTTPGTLATTAATTMALSKRTTGAIKLAVWQLDPGEDKNVHISNVPKSTTQELLFVVFPTAYSIQMPRDGKDKGAAVLQFRSQKCAEDVMKCYTSITINKTKLKLMRKTPTDKTVTSVEEAEKPAETTKKNERSETVVETCLGVVTSTNYQTYSTEQVNREYSRKCQECNFICVSSSAWRRHRKKNHSGLQHFLAEGKDIKGATAAEEANEPQSHAKTEAITDAAKTVATKSHVLKSSKVFQIPVLNKRTPKSIHVSAAKGRNMPPDEPPDAKRPRLDQPPPGYTGFPVPGSIPPPVPPAVQGFSMLPTDFSVPPPGHGAAWPLQAAQPLPNHADGMSGGSGKWQTPQRQGYEPDSDLQGTEAISPEWDEDVPRQPSRDSPRGREGRDGGKAWFSRQGRPMQRRSLSPARNHQHRGMRSPGRELLPQRHRSTSGSPGREPLPQRHRISSRSPGREPLPQRRRSRSWSPGREPLPQRPRSSSRSPMRRIRRSSLSPTRLASNQQYRSRSPLRHHAGARRFSSRSPPKHHKRENYSPVSQGRLSRSPRRVSHSPKRQGSRQGRSNYSPVSQGRLSRSPGKRGVSPRRKFDKQGSGSGFERKSGPASSGRQDHRSYSPISQGRLSRSPGRKNRSPGRETYRQEKNLARQSNRSYSPVSQGRLSRSPPGRGQIPVGRQGQRQKGHSPPRKRATSPKLGHSSDRSNMGSATAGKERQFDFSFSRMPHNQHETKTHSPALQPKASNQTPAGWSYGSGRQSSSPGRQNRSAANSQAGSNGGRQNYSPEHLAPNPSLRQSTGVSQQRPDESMQQQGRRGRDEVGEKPSVDRGGWSINTNLPPSSSVAAPSSSSRATLFPSAFSTSTSSSSVLFPSASTMAIPGLDLLLKATGGKESDADSKSKLWPLPPEQASALRKQGAESAKGDMYQVEESKLTPSEDAASSWWRGDNTKSSPLFDKPGSRDAGPAARDGQGVTCIKSTRDLMSLRQEAAKHLANMEKTPSSRIMDLESSRTLDTGRPLASQGPARPLGETPSATEYRQTGLPRDLPPPSRELLAARGFEVRGLGDNRPARDTTASNWNRTTVGINIPGLDQVGLDRTSNRFGLDRPALDRPGLDRLDQSVRDRIGLDRPGLDRPGLDRVGLERPGMDRLGFDRPGLERPGLDRSGLDRTVLDRSGLDRIGLDRPGLNLSGLDRPGLDRLGLDRPGLDRSGLDPPVRSLPGLDHAGSDRLGLNRPGLDRLGMDHPSLDRPGLDRSGLDRPRWEEDRPSVCGGNWGKQQVQDWDHGRSGPPSSQDVGGGEGKNRPLGSGYGIMSGSGGGSRDLGPGQPLGGLTLGSDLRQIGGLTNIGDGGSWQPIGGVGSLGANSGNAGGMMGSSFGGGGGGSWLPPPRMTDQQSQQLRLPFMPRPPL